MMARSIALTLLAAASCLGGCASLQRDAVGQRENLLAAAGFAVVPANTPQRQDMLARLPPNRVSQLIQGEQVSYIYPDPLLCRCLYVGGQPQFGQYQAYVQQRAIAEEQITASQLSYGGAWDWGPWGGFGVWR